MLVTETQVASSLIVRTGELIQLCKGNLNMILAELIKVSQ